MDKNEINILADILANKKICIDVFDKSYNVWMHDFKMVYWNYGRSVFGDDVFCEVKDIRYMFYDLGHPERLILSFKEMEYMQQRIDNGQLVLRKDINEENKIDNNENENNNENDNDNYNADEENNDNNDDNNENEEEENEEEENEDD